MRKPTLERWKRYVKIEMCTQPKIRLRVFCHPEYGFSVHFGDYYRDHLKSVGKLWKEDGKPTDEQQRHFAGFWGWVNDTKDWEHLWRCIKRFHVDDAIHNMDLVKKIISLCWGKC